MDRLRTLELFVAVADNRSFAGGARQLGVSNPTATRGIALLEERLGIQLFIRTTRSLTLTELGKTYLLECKKILEDLQQAEAFVAGVYQRPKGKIRVTSSVLFGERFITPLVTRYLDRFQNTSVETLFVDRVTNLVDEGIDVAVRIGKLGDSNLNAVAVGSVRRVLCASPDYLKRQGTPTDLEELKDHQLISARPLTAGTEWHFSNSRYIRVVPRLEVNTLASAVNAAKQGWGIAQVLSYQILDEIKAGTLCTLLTGYEPEPLPIHLIYSGGRRVPMKTRAFIDLAKEELRSLNLA